MGNWKNDELVKRGKKSEDGSGKREEVDSCRLQVSGYRFAVCIFHGNLPWESLRGQRGLREKFNVQRLK